MQGLPEKSVNCCVTSPPYFGLRDYGHAGQIGLEKTPDEFVAKMVEVFREVRRVLRDDGTLWLNLGDSYAGSWGNAGGQNRGNGKQREITAGSIVKDQAERNGNFVPPAANGFKASGIKPKDLIGIPWRVAFALQSDGWYLRQDIIWHKPNPMPESVRDRCTKAHEYIFMLSKSARYYYDADAIKTAPSEALLKQVAEGYSGESTKGYAAGGAQDASGTKTRIIENARKKIDKQRGHGRRHDGFNGRWDSMTKAEQQMLGANKRDVWTIATKPFKGAHFATFPPDLIEPCILAGSKPGDLVLDPFGGAGTTGLVAARHGRRYILCELNADYAKMAEERIAADQQKRLEALL